MIMGEAKRRAELGLPPRQKNIALNKSDRYLSWLPITKSRIKKYPYMGVATMALGAIIFLVSGGANSICLLYTSPSPRDRSSSRMPSSA